MTHKTKGIVLRTIRYGETSIIVSIYTELFGIQSYLINGVRTISKKGSSKTNLFQSGAILDLIAYHNELKNLQRVKEYKWSYLYKNIFYDVIKNAVVQYMIELLQKTIKQPEPNINLFHFIEDAFIQLDESDETMVANFPLFFSLQLTAFYGFRISDTYSEKNNILDLQEGEFIHEQPLHPHFIEGDLSFITSQLLKVMHPNELVHIRLNKEIRRMLLQSYQNFYALHIQDFGTMKTVPVLHAILG